MSLSLHQLAVFHAVALEGSISRGADRLFICQPAVSRHVRDLEASLGLRLFDRLPRGVRLTSAGEELARYARRMFALQREAERAMADMAGLHRGSLAIAASTTIGIYLLPEVLGSFRQRYPKIELSLEIANTSVVQQLLVDGTADVVLTEGFVERTELEAEVFYEDELVAVAPPQHPLLDRPVITGADLCREPAVLREPGSGTRAVVEAALEKQGLHLRPVMSLGSTEAIKRAVAAGVGVAIVSRLTITQELETRRLAVVPLEELVIRRPLHLVRLKGRRDSVVVCAFLEVLRTFVENANDDSSPRAAGAS